MRGMQASERRAPVEPRMNLEVGRLTALDAVKIAGVSLGALIVASIGGMLAWAARPDRWGHFSGGGGAQVWLWVLGNGISVVSLVLGGVVLWLTVRSWLRYESRLADWHDVSIAAYDDAGGIAVETTVTAWELQANDLRSLLLLVVSLQAAYQGGESTPHSVRALAGARWIHDDQGRQHRLGDVNQHQAEQLARQLAALGLVEGRADRRAGTWVAQSYDQAITLTLANWHRVASMG